MNPKDRDAERTDHFSSDRSMAEYCLDIWGVEALQFA
jgi:hypothetical protein